LYGRVDPCPSTSMPTSFIETPMLLFSTIVLTARYIHK
jgi:hypothetical protein